MDLGDYERALDGFEMSLDVNPDGFSAFFSRGECLMKLGRFEEAEEVFKEGMELFPEKKDLCEEFYKKTFFC
jgi:tetratricopeptide (TPR) repeat protein